MKFPYFFLLLACTTSSVYAQSQKITSTQVLNSLNKLQSEVSQLKRKVEDLQARQTRLEKTHNSSASKTETPIKTVDHNPTKVTVGEKNQYEIGQSLLKKGSYNQAITEFQALIDTYPHGEYADNSQYWIGEALLRLGQKQQAMQAFDQVLRDYPESAKVPDALLKLGITQASVGNKLKAKEYYDYVINNYPNASAANLAYSYRQKLGL